MTTEQLKQAQQYKTYQDFIDREPTYADTLEVCKDLVGFASDQLEGEDSLRLISLVSQLTVLYRTKTPEATPIDILNKAYGTADTRAAYKQYRQISVMCELFITPNAKFSLHGFKSVAEMLVEVKRIMELWLPF